MLKELIDHLERGRGAVFGRACPMNGSVSHSVVTDSNGGDGQVIDHEPAGPHTTAVAYRGGD